MGAYERAGVLLRIHLFKCGSWAENAGKTRTGGIGAREQKYKSKGWELKLECQMHGKVGKQLERKNIPEMAFQEKEIG